MVSSIFNFLGGQSLPAPKGKVPMRALPASWYTSAAMYELERRAVFSKKWMLITHQVRLDSPGAWLKYTVAGYEFVLCRDRHGNINAFHNVCRHRAYPIVQADQGQSRIFACKYHGWSYGLDGKLAKAPGYQELDDFDKSKNNLFPIHVHIDSRGFIWINLDSTEQPEIAWNDDFEGVDKQARFERFDFSAYKFDHVWETEGDFNWKLLADNYNECYHCATTHPDVTAAVADLSTYSVDTKGGHIQHFANPKEETKDRRIEMASTYYFPNASMTVSPPFFFVQRVEPVSALKTMLRYEVFRHRTAPPEDFERIDAMFKRIMTEDKWLCAATQRNLNAGVFVNGEMHPRMEKGPLYFQQYVRELVLNHRRREQERAGGREIWPARQPANPVSAADLEFCDGLACERSDSDESGSLSW